MPVILGNACIQNALLEHNNNAVRFIGIMHLYVQERHVIQTALIGINANYQTTNRELIYHHS